MARAVGTAGTPCFRDTSGLFGVVGDVFLLPSVAFIVKLVIEVSGCLFGVDLGVAISLSLAPRGLDFGVDNRSFILASMNRFSSLTTLALGVPKLECAAAIRDCEDMDLDIGERGVFGGGAKETGGKNDFGRSGVDVADLFESRFKIPGLEGVGGRGGVSGTSLPVRSLANDAFRLCFLM